MTENNALFRSIRDKNVEIFLTFTKDIPKLLSERDSIGQSVLHHSIEFRSKEIFDFLLTIDEVDLNVRDKDGTTPLHVASIFTEGDPYYARKLLEKGANANLGALTNETPLHWAVGCRENSEITSLLIRHGADIDACADLKSRSSVLLEAIDNECPEIVEMLLYYGVDVLSPNVYSPFEAAVISLQSGVQKSLLPYAFDNLESVDLELVTKIMDFCEPEMVLEILEVIGSIVYDFDELGPFGLALSRNHEDVLKVFLHKFDYVFEDLVSTRDVLRPFLAEIWADNSAPIRKLRLVLESEFAPEFVQSYESEQSVFEFLSRLSEDDIEEFGSIFLSYGLEISTADLFLVYRYEPSSKNSLFKLMLHMDIKDLNNFGFDFEPSYYIESVVPALIFDPCLSIEKFLTLPRTTFPDSLVHYLLNFSVLPEVKRRALECEIPVDFGGSPDVPSLVEWARNACRKLLIERFRISKCQQYLSIVNKLDVPKVCKEILCFYRRLYNITF